MADLLDTDLLLVQRGGKSYKFTGGELRASLRPKTINPAPGDVSATPPFVSGTGTQADPYILTPVRVLAAGGTEYTAQELSVISGSAGDLVQFSDLSTGAGGRFVQPLGTVDSTGEWRGRLRYQDAPASTADTTYTGDLQLGTTYFRWVVTQDVGVPIVVVTPSTLAGTARVGQTLTMTAGSATDGKPPIGYTYRWERSADGIAWVTIVGAGALTYALVPDDYDHYVRGVTIATDATPQTLDLPTPSSAKVVYAPLVAGTASTVAGSPNVGTALTMTPGTATGGYGSISYTYRWERSATGVGGWGPIAGATALTYTLVAADDTNHVRGVTVATDQATPTAQTFDLPTSSVGPVVSTVAPAISTVVLADNAPGGNRFTSSGFTTTITMTNDGVPASTKKLKGKVVGKLTASYDSSAITAAVNITPAWVTITATGVTAVLIKEKLTSVGSTIIYAGKQSSDGALYFGYASTSATTFTNAASPPTAAAGTDVNAMITVGSTVYVLLSNKTLWTSTNGSSWSLTHTFTGSYLHLVDMGSVITAVGIAGTALGSGSAWTEYAVSPAGGGPVNNAVRAGTLLVVVSGSRVASSTDNGRTWRTGNIAAGNWLDAAYNSTTGEIFAYPNNSGGQTFIRSTNNGLSWTTVTGSGWVGGVSASQPIIYSSSRGGWLSNFGAFSTDLLNWSPLIGGHTECHAETSGGVYVTGADVSCVRTSSPTLTGRDLTFTTDLNLAELHIGMTVTGYNAGTSTGATAKVVSVNVATRKVNVNPLSGVINVGNTIHWSKTAAGTTKYLVFDAAGAVSTMQTTDPGWVQTTAQTAPVLTFPATFPSGQPPDTELPAGTTIQTEVQATNAGGSPTLASNIVTPA